MSKTKKQLQDDLSDAISEIERLRAIIANPETFEANIGKFTDNTITYRGGIALKILAYSAMEFFLTTGAENYIEQEIIPALSEKNLKRIKREWLPFSMLVTITRRNGKTPGQVAREFKEMAIKMGKILVNCEGDGGDAKGILAEFESLDASAYAELEK